MILMLVNLIIIINLVSRSKGKDILIKIYKMNRHKVDIYHD